MASLPLLAYLRKDLDIADLSDACWALKRQVGCEKKAQDYITGNFLPFPMPGQTTIDGDILQVVMSSTPERMQNEDDQNILDEVHEQILADMERETNELIKQHSLNLDGPNKLYEECTDAYHTAVYRHMQLLALQRALALSAPREDNDIKTLKTPGNDDIRAINAYRDSMVDELRELGLETFEKGENTGDPKSRERKFAFQSRWHCKHSEPDLWFQIRREDMDIRGASDTDRVAAMLDGGLFEKGAMMKNRRTGKFTTMLEEDMPGSIFGWQGGGVWAKEEALKLVSSGINLREVQKGILL